MFNVTKVFTLYSVNKFFTIHCTCYCSCEGRLNCTEVLRRSFWSNGCGGLGNRESCCNLRVFSIVTFTLQYNTCCIFTSCSIVLIATSLNFKVCAVSQSFDSEISRSLCQTGISQSVTSISSSLTYEAQSTDNFKRLYIGLTTSEVVLTGDSHITSTSASIVCERHIVIC